MQTALCKQLCINKTNVHHSPKVTNCQITFFSDYNVYNALVSPM